MVDPRKTVGRRFRPPDSAQSESIQKERLRFDWSKVSDRVCSNLLDAAAQASTDDFEAPAVPEHLLRSYLANLYGRQPSYKKVEHWEAWGVLRNWALRDATPAQLDELVVVIRHTAPGGWRLEDLTTQANRREFLRSRRWTAHLQKNLLDSFIRSHKSKQPVGTSTSGSRGSSTPYPRLLQGRGASQLPLHGYQSDAIRALDALLTARSPEKRRGLVVLPTGGGKTRTAVAWAVGQLAKSRQRRVLWMAHQEELLLQAADTFEKVSESEAPHFQRRVRIISGGHDTTSCLADPELDVAIVTWQSLHRNWARNWRLLDKFTSRPTLVVVDEAHHAGSPAYEKILTHLEYSPRIAMVGLSATPWPTDSTAAGRLRRRFPQTIAQVTVDQLHAQGILAVPTVHTIDTHQHLALTTNELKLSKGDLHPSVLAHLQNAARDSIIIRAWEAHPAVWGKTLIFATSKMHADHLGRRFAERAANVRVLHSGIADDRHEILTWFQDPDEPCSVLISVGMLTEGVDLPAARTAFLARPTTSRILMRQMIGRVLRGPGAGGTDEANLVYLRDVWSNFEDVLEPGELPDVPSAAGGEGEDGLVRRLPPVKDEDGDPIPEDILAQLRRMYARRVDRIPLDPATSSTVLCGYYVTVTGHVPVMEHQRDGYRALIQDLRKKVTFQGRGMASLFDDDHPPYPTDRQLATIRAHVAATCEAPPFVEMRSSIDPRAVAMELRQNPLSEDERESRLRERYESSLARIAYQSFDHFEEAVERELRELRQTARSGRNRLNAERPVASRTMSPQGSVPLRRSSERALPDLNDVIAKTREALAGEDAIHLLEEGVYVPPQVAWTRTDVTSTWAHWSLKTTGVNKGTATIRVNRLLQAPRTQVSDEVLEYLLFHELLHDLLPGRGHDAEFRRLEGIWPNSDQLDLILDTLHEQFSLRKARR